MENNELLQRSVEIGETTFGLVKCEGKPDSQILDWTVTFQLGVFCALTLTRLDSTLVFIVLTFLETFFPLQQ